MPRRPNPVPSYRRHKQSGQAIVTIPLGGGRRRDVLLGRYGSPESKREYERVLAELRAAREQPARADADGRAPGDPTVDELILAFWEHAQGHYRRADGSPTNELTEYRLALRPLRALYGHTPAREFGPLGLKAVRQTFLEGGLCRTQVNRRTGRVRRVFKWGVAEELVPVTVYQALAAVAGLQKGRTTAPETDPVGPVPVAAARAVQPKLRPETAGLVELQLVTGMRPGEACRIRPCDVDRSGPVWVYRPPEHKNEWRGKPRAVALGPRAQALLARFEPPTPTDYYFSPRRAVESQRAARAAARKTPRYPSHVARAAGRRPAAAPARAPADRYTAGSYGRAVGRACRRAGVPHFHPNQLRHTFATEVRKRFGLEAAQALLGHEKADTTQIYAEKNLALAAAVAAEIG